MRPSPTPSPPCGCSGSSSLESSSPEKCPAGYSHKVKLDPKPSRVKGCHQAIEQAADDKILEIQSLGHASGYRGGPAPCRVAEPKGRRPARQETKGALKEAQCSPRPVTSPYPAPSRST